MFCRYTPDLKKAATLYFKEVCRRAGGAGGQVHQAP
jgi:hypothetical protein